jgi:hypothetical protein
MTTKSRETINGGSVRAAAERAIEARKEADRLAYEAWNKRMLGQGRRKPAGRPVETLTRLLYDEARDLDSDQHEERLEEDFLVRVEEQNR